MADTELLNHTSSRKKNADQCTNGVTMKRPRAQHAEPPPTHRGGRWLAMCPETRALHQLLSTPRPEHCLPMHGRACNVATRLEQLKAGGCWRLSGTHRLSAPLLLRCPTQIIGEAGALLSGGRELPQLRQRGERLWVSGPTGALQRQLFASGAAAERGPLVRLPIASVRPRHFGGSVLTTADGFVGAPALCDLLLRAVNGIEVRPIRRSRHSLQTHPIHCTLLCTRWARCSGWRQSTSANRGTSHAAPSQTSYDMAGGASS